MKRPFVSSLGFICPMICPIVFPGPAASLELSLAADLRHIDYEEFGANRQSLNRETGFIAGLRLAGSTASPAAGHTIEFGAWGGEVDYDGSTQSGQPHRTDTEETILRLRYRFDWRPRDPEGSLYAQIDWQNWDRDIQPASGVSGLFERYQWWTLEAGLRATLWQQQDRRLDFELGVLQTTRGTILIDLSDQGYGRPRLDLGDSPGATLALEYTMQLAGDDSLNFGLGYQRWRFGRSDSRAVSNGVNTIIITEPDSLSNHVTLSVGYVVRY